MQILTQLSILLSLCFMGELLRPLLPISLPSSIIAMLLLLLLLALHVIREDHIQDVGDFFLKNMGFFFVPSAVGILEYFDVIKAAIVPFLLVCLITLILTFAATAYTAMLLQRLQGYFSRGGEKHD